MKLYVPHYFKDFHCIASECKDNCCYGGWEIDIDDETANYYLALEGEFGDQLRDSITRTDEYCFKLEDGHCPFLDQHNLCKIYQNLGEDKMGVVCTQFPRYSEYYGARKETGIGLACEEAERIIFEDREPFSLVESEFEEEEVEYPDYDEDLANALFPVRDRIMKLIEDQSLEFRDVLSILIVLGNEIQELVNLEEIDEDVYDRIADFAHFSKEQFCKMVDHVKDELNEEDDKENCEEEYEEDCADNSEEVLTQQDGIDRIIAAYQNLEILNDDWPDYMDHVVTLLHEESQTAEAYQQLATDYWISQQSNEYQYRNLLKYFIYRYMMKSVYDHDVYAKLLMTVTNFLIIREMDITRWLDHDRTFTFEDRIDTVHIFSREVEYSEDNLEDLKEEFLFDPIFHADQMVALLSRI